jgi:hypothetical protein
LKDRFEQALWIASAKAVAEAVAETMRKRSP